MNAPSIDLGTLGQPRKNWLRHHAVNFIRFADEPATREWIVDDMIPSRQVTLLTGDGGTGKSNLALQLQCATSGGTSWLGKRTAQCRSIGVYCEDETDELHRRVRSIWRASGLSLSDAAFSYAECISGVGMDNALVSFESVTERGDFQGELVRRQRWRETDTYADILDWALESEARLVILDSNYNFFTGNENSRSEVQFFVGKLAHIAREIDGAVLVAGHPSLTGQSSGSGLSGSTAWHNAVRSRLYLTKPSRAEDGESADDGVRILKGKKSNYGPESGKLRLIWQDGVFKPEQRSEGMVAAIEKRNREKTVVEAIRSVHVQDKQMAISDSANQPNYVIKVFRSLGLCGGMAPGEIEQILIRLRAEGAVVYGEIGRTAGRRPRMSYMVPAEGAA